MYDGYVKYDRSYILRSAVTDVCSENDATFKLWGEVFEILFAGKQDIYLRWGETTSSLTTDQKKLNRPGDKHVVGLKVDCRAVAYFANNKLDIDLMNMEAAKEYEDDKICHDCIKPIAEAKCSLDYLLNSPNLTDEKKAALVISIVQIAGSKCEVCCYRLVANGLYTLQSVGSLTLSPIFTEFSHSSYAWFKLLNQLKSMVLTLYDAAVLSQQKNTKDFVETPTTSLPSVSMTSTRGTFFPPTEASPVPRIPPNLYSPSCPPLYNTDSNESNKRLKENI
jgi:hypothetical protein